LSKLLPSKDQWDSEAPDDELFDVVDEEEDVDGGAGGTAADVGLSLPPWAEGDDADEGGTANDAGFSPPPVTEPVGGNGDADAGLSPRPAKAQNQAMGRHETPSSRPAKRPAKPRTGETEAAPRTSLEQRRKPSRNDGDSRQVSAEAQNHIQPASAAFEPDTAPKKRKLGRGTSLPHVPDAQLASATLARSDTAEVAAHTHASGPPGSKEKGQASLPPRTRKAEGPEKRTDTGRSDRGKPLFGNMVFRLGTLPRLSSEDEKSIFKLSGKTWAESLEKAGCQYVCNSL
jgi:hypothetical protein